MLFDSTALILSLIASVIAKWPANSQFTYGFGRVETLTGFANALALVFASVGIIWEACERMLDPPKLEDLNKLLIVSILGFLVNLVGIFAFDHGGMGHDHGHGGHGHSHGHESHSFGHEHEPKGGHSHADEHSHGGHAHESHGGHGGHSHGGYADYEPVTAASSHHHHGGSHSHSHNPLMHGMFLHVLSDTLGSVGVIISTLFIMWFGWTWTDPFISLVIAVLTLVSIWPLLKGSSNTLLQRIPESLDSYRLSECYRKITQMEGVVGYTSPHFWELSQGKNMGTIKIQINDRCNPDLLRIKIVAVFRDVGVTDMVVQMEKDVVQGY
ncbi:cation efflux protein [Rhizoclosmatium globosum]|uniref:Cation efflux protein n=1 Tax=Rhizoclosmatium globosum TaxID=329046 RepID=A0A1Y2BQC6_9FUNG|nr:cation efflux protein [Rhizoclosmatium globosum]|eukprot:ORY36940.1 cation efflux protein [Rhizoclosmatium globosum]